MAKSNRIKNILVLGGSGQIGSDLKVECKKHRKFKYFFPDSTTIDIRKKNSIKNYLEKNKVNVVLNFAAYTKVDQAEKSKKICSQINHIGASSLALELRKRNIGLIHFSTDYVFGKGANKIRHIDDKHSPINHYGLTKAKGEKGVLNNSDLGMVIRLASVFGKYGNNFIKNIIKLMLTKDKIQIISDQKISMTSSYELSKNMNYLIELYNKNINKNINIIHFTNKGYTTWYLVAKIIKGELEELYKRKLGVKLKPIKAKDWSSLAKRPIDSRLKVDFKELEKNKIFLPNWDVSIRKEIKKILPTVIEELKNEEQK